jgi:hypothetical protein
MEGITECLWDGKRPWPKLRHLKNMKNERERPNSSKADTTLNRPRNNTLSTEASKEIESYSSWPYPTDYLDHFETSSQALSDIEPALYR